MDVAVTSVGVVALAWAARTVAFEDLVVNADLEPIPATVLRRYRALHDGPLRILTAIAGPGPVGHPDPLVRRQCAVSVNVQRGATPDAPGGTLTDLSLALIEAGNESAAYGLRVEYHFANLPAAVTDALRLAPGAGVEQRGLPRGGHPGSV